MRSSYGLKATAAVELHRTVSDSFWKNYMTCYDVDSKQETVYFIIYDVHVGITPNPGFLFRLCPEALKESLE